MGGNTDAALKTKSKSVLESAPALSVSILQFRNVSMTTSKKIIIKL